MDYIKSYYDLPFLKPGMKLEIAGKKCTAVKEKNGSLRVKFENGSEGPIHPTWETVYFDDKGNIIKDFRKKKSISSSFADHYKETEPKESFPDNTPFEDQAVDDYLKNNIEHFSGFGHEDGGSFGGGGASGDWGSRESDSSSNFSCLD